jgi:beta-glucosidase
MQQDPTIDPRAIARMFPRDFTWGVATSAFQIEGATREDGRGESIWDRFCRQPGAIADGSDGDVACDHYHRWQEDLNLVASLGVNAYRFSVAWPRVQPLGHGAFNPRGLDFYERLVDGLLRRGIAPHLTLDHWDLPQALQERGGWAQRDTVHRFVDYAREVARRLGSRLRSITTHNEPFVQSVLGHETGIFAPGIRDRGVAIQVAHHLLLSHGLALQALRADGVHSDLGIVLNLSPIEPASDSEADRARARLEDGRLVRWYMDPLLRGSYPQDVVEALGADAPRVEPGDMQTIAAPLDFLGVNYYSRNVFRADGVVDPHTLGSELTDMGWEVYPQGLTDLLCRLHRDYALPDVYVTENGAAFPDDCVDSRVVDVARTRYIASHIAAAGRALAAGVPLKGFMVWSLLDNFEWASGYAKRFGIVHVDYATQRRTPKASADWYRDFLRAERMSAAA